MTDVLTCRLCGRQGGPLGWKLNKPDGGVVCSDREACAERQAQGGHYPAPDEAIETRPVDDSIIEAQFDPDSALYAPTIGQPEPSTMVEDPPEDLPGGPTEAQDGPTEAQEDPSGVQEPPEKLEPTPEYSRAPEGPAKERAQSENPDLDPYTCHRCGRQGRRGFERDDQEPGAPPVCRNRRICDNRIEAEARKANRGRCVDCVKEGVTTERQPALTGNGDPVPGNRCVTHQRALIKARKRASHAGRTLLKYRITGDQYWALYDALGGRCFICRRATGKAKNLAVDHDHHLAATHDHPDDEGCELCIRCLACGPCNNEVLGRLDVDGLLRAILVLTNPPARTLLQGLPYDTDGLVAAMRQALPLPASSKPELFPSAHETREVGQANVARILQHLEAKGWDQTSSPLTQDEVDAAAADLGVPSWTVGPEDQRDDQGYLPGQREDEHQVENPESYHGDPLASDDWSAVAADTQDQLDAEQALRMLGQARNRMPTDEQALAVFRGRAQFTAISHHPPGWSEPGDQPSTPVDPPYHYVMSAEGRAIPTRHALASPALSEVTEAFWRGPEGFWDQDG